MVLSLGLLSGFLSARGTNPDERGGNDDRSDMVDGEGGDKDSGNGWKYKLQIQFLVKILV